MKKMFFSLILLIFLTGCTINQSVASEQSIQEIIQPEPTIKEETKSEVTPLLVEQNISQPEEINTTIVETNTTILEEIKQENNVDELNIHNKCRLSAIIYAGCKWTSEEEITFNMRVGNAGKYPINGGWLIVTGESGGVKNIKRPETIPVGMIVTYNINYQDLVKEIGKIKRLEFLPIEEINGTSYACNNMRVYTIPETYCKPSEALNVDNITG